MLRPLCVGTGIRRGCCSPLAEGSIDFGAGRAAAWAGKVLRQHYGKGAQVATKTIVTKSNQYHNRWEEVAFSPSMADCIWARCKRKQKFLGKEEMCLIDIFNVHRYIVELIAHHIGKNGIGKNNCELGLQAVLKITFILELTAKQHDLTHNFVKALKDLLYIPESPNKMQWFIC